MVTVAACLLWPPSPRLLGSGCSHFCCHTWLHWPLLLGCGSAQWIQPLQATLFLLPSLRSQNQLPRDSKGGSTEVPDLIWQPSLLFLAVFQLVSMGGALFRLLGSPLDVPEMCWGKGGAAGYGWVLGGSGTPTSAGWKPQLSTEKP